MTRATPTAAHSHKEDKLRTAIAMANIPTLLMVLVQLTGNLLWLENPYRPTRNTGIDDNDTGGLLKRIQAEIREAAYHSIRAWRAGRPVALPVPSEDLLVRMLSVSMGEPIPDEYGLLIAAELGIDSGSPTTREKEDGAKPPARFNVIIIGAGVSGLCAAIKLHQVGISYTIIERNETVGGTWLENHYPGAGVDTPNHLYSFSFAQHDWSHYFSFRDELHAYLERIATEFAIRPHIRLQTEVVKAAYDESSQGWTVEVRGSGRTRETLRANVVISAVGAFNPPKIPNIKGWETFEGPCFHTARWPEGLDLKGKKVAIIGNGASAMQVVPAIADTVSHLSVFQRSPQWAAPFEKLHAPVPDPVRWLLREVPLYQAWYRLRLGWTFNDKVHASLQKDPSWTKQDRSINRTNEAHRQFFTRYIKSELGDRQDLLAKSLPKYPPFGKRMLLDNGWFRTLTKEHVDLVMDPIAEVRSDHVVTRSGTEYDADLIILATGFDVVRFLAPMEIRGRSGTTLQEEWDDDDARAYLGLAVPGFPNFFCLFGPNTGTAHGGSYVFIAECQMQYIMTLLKQMFAAGIGSVECRREVHAEYNERVDAANNAMIWTHPGMETYYRNSRGRVVYTNPWRIVDYWHMTRHAELNDYVLEPTKEEAHGAASDLPRFTAY